jgi:hypothetical protein
VAAPDPRRREYLSRLGCDHWARRSWPSRTSLRGNVLIVRQLYTRAHTRTGLHLPRTLLVHCPAKAILFCCDRSHLLIY